MVFHKISGCLVQGDVKVEGRGQMGPQPVPNHYRDVFCGRNSVGKFRNFFVEVSVVKFGLNFAFDEA
jgi:hypothetical protein